MKRRLPSKDFSRSSYTVVEVHIRQINGSYLLLLMLLLVFLGVSYFSKDLKSSIFCSFCFFARFHRFALHFFGGICGVTGVQRKMCTFLKLKFFCFISICFCFELLDHDLFRVHFFTFKFFWVMGLWTEA